MKTRCKPGDTAVILYDESSCVFNVGRLVKVYPTLQYNRELKQNCWLIEPIDNNPWAVSNKDGTVTMEHYILANGIEHPDAWMLPIRDEQGVNVMTQEEFDAYERIQKRIDEDLVKIGAVKHIC